MIELNEAIKQVREDVLKGKTLCIALTDAAADFELNPALIGRKFHEKYGSVEKVLEAVKFACPAKSLDDLAMEQATKWMGRFTRTPEGFGKRFKVGGVQYIYVANKGGVRPVVAIDVARAQEVVLGMKSSQEAFRQVV